EPLPVVSVPEYLPASSTRSNASFCWPVSSFTIPSYLPAHEACGCAFVAETNSNSAKVAHATLTIFMRFGSISFFLSEFTASSTLPRAPAAYFPGLSSPLSPTAQMFPVAWRQSQQESSDPVPHPPISVHA